MYKLGNDDNNSDKIVALIGGDKRELQVVPALLSAGWQVTVFGLPQHLLPAEANVVFSIQEALSNADIVILPLPGIRGNGELHAPFYPPMLVHDEDFAVIPKGTPIIVGVASKYLKQMAEKYGLPMKEVAELDDIAIPNAVPTAEGAIQLTMAKLPVTIDGLKALVIGYGRVGEALSSRLRALGARVTVTNRSTHRFGLAAKDGYHIFPWESFADALPQMQVVYNTVPSPVLDRSKIALMPKESLIVDLASMPGGTDFKAAEELHIEAIHALSLPGQVAPVSAGKILAGAYPRIIHGLLAARNFEETLPKETLPKETLPKETLPKETLPKETEPEETVKGGSPQ